MTSVILALCPTVSEDLTKFWLALVRDKASTIKKKYGANPTLYDRRAAATELADRVHGRPVQAIEIDERPDVPAFVLPAETPGVNVH